MKYERFPAMRGAVPATAAVSGDNRRHADQHAHYSHQMTEETGAAAGRAVVRIVPLLYGLLLGGLSENLSMGVALGVIVAITLDLWMGERSIARPLVERLAPWRGRGQGAAL